jgi:hypothetical protein
MVAEFVGRRSQDHRDRPRNRAGRMADWDATPPIAWRRTLGSAQQARKQPDRAAGIFRVRRTDRVLHGFIKKTQKTPPTEIALAQKRMKEMMK